jgi:hypothetical protein
VSDTDREAPQALIEAVREWAADEWPGGIEQASEFEADAKARTVLVALAALEPASAAPSDSGAWVDLAAELRARAEKARAEANRSAASDGLLYAGLMVEARTYDEAASLVEALRSPARDDLAERLEELAGAVSVGFPGTPEQYEEMREDLFDLARLARASAPSEVRVGGWEVRSEGMHGEPPHAIERGTGPDLEVFVTGIESYDDACKIEAALNEPAPPDPAPDDGPCPECGSLSRLNRMCPACCKPAPDRVAERTRAYERECRHRLNVAIHAHLSAAEQYPPDHPAVLRTRREMADAFGFDPDIEPASTGVREEEGR